MTGQRTLPYRPWQPLEASDVTVAEILRRHGYINVMVSDTYHYRAPGMNFHRHFNSYRWIRGQEYDPYESGLPRRRLDEYVNENYPELWRGRIHQFLANTDAFYRPHDWFAPQVAGEAARWLERNRAHPRVFLWVDSFDHHEPWDPPRRFDTYTDPAYTGRRLIMPMGGQASDWANADEIKHIQGLYAGEAESVDFVLGEVFDTLERLGYYENNSIDGSGGRLVRYRPMMSLLVDLLDAACQAPPLIAVDLVAGPRFTAIAAATTVDAAPVAGGVAYTNAGDHVPGFDVEAATRAIAGAVIGRPLAAIVGALAPGNGVAVGDVAHDVGVAALNALLASLVQRNETPLESGNGLELLARAAAGKRLAVVGRFPYLQEIRSEAAQSWVLELEPEGDELPAQAAAGVIPLADVVGITGSTLANGTLEGLLALCRPGAVVAVIGPTTPLSPVLFRYGARVLCGSLMEQPALALERFRASGSTRRLPGMRHVVWRW